MCLCELVSASACTYVRIHVCTNIRTYDMQVLFHERVYRVVTQSHPTVSCIIIIVLGYTCTVYILYISSLGIITAYHRTFCTVCTYRSTPTTQLHHFSGTFTHHGLCQAYRTETGGNLLTYMHTSYIYSTTYAKGCQLVY